MVAIVRTEWTGTSGGPGLTQFCLMGGGSMTAGTAQSLVNATRSFWETMKSYLPDELRLVVLPTVDVYNDANGELTHSFVAPVAPVYTAGASTSGYAAASGMKINWNTGVIRNGRRVRGATFIVPASMDVYSTTGQIQSGVMTTVSSAATTLMGAYVSAGAPLVVWSRPLEKDGVITRPGATAGVINGTCGSKSAILRGRRD